MLLLLLADAQAALEHPATWIAVAGSAITVIGTVAGIWIQARLNTRTTTLENRVESCEERHKACEEDRATTKAELKTRDDKDKAELKAEIAVLRTQVNGGPAPH